MDRRGFLANSIVASAAAAGLSPQETDAAEARPGDGQRDYYLLRRYFLRGGAQGKLCNDYFRNALIPAANRLSVKPVGVFDLLAGPQTPSIYVLLAGSSVETLAGLDSRLEQDEEYLKGGAPFLQAPAESPAFDRMESSLMAAFEGRPGIEVPPAAAEHRPRTFELRTYESPSERDHRRKIEMFHSGEFDIFRRAGFRPVFYGDTLIGPRMPQLTYMLCFDDLADRNKLWEAFRTDPRWTRLTHDPRFDFEPIVTNVTNLFLSPAEYSQI